MPDSLRIAVAGLAHDHIWDHLDDLAGSPSSEFVGAAEADGQLRSKIEKQYGCPTWNDWQQMLDDVELDGIYVYASNQQGATIATSAAERGLHVMIEKPMAANYSGARQMRDASVRNNVRLVVNWPFAWWPQMQDALRCIEDGEIGRVWQVKYTPGPPNWAAQNNFATGSLMKRRTAAEQ